MFIIRKTFKVPIGHRLSKHQGLCKNIHGHNLKIEVQVSSPTLNQNDMVMDFSDLKEMVKTYIERLDHCALLNINDKENVQYIHNCDYKVQLFPGDPTAEALARYLYQELSDKFEKLPQRIQLDYVHVWENENSMAGYHGERSVEIRTSRRFK